MNCLHTDIDITYTIWSLLSNDDNDLLFSLTIIYYFYFQLNDVIISYS